MTTRRAVIAGGGIGGLAAGLALARHGWEVEVLEQAPQLAEVGAGIQISPNGMHVLDMPGVTPLIEDALFEPEAVELRMGRSGRRIFRLPMKDIAQARWGNRFVQIPRGGNHVNFVGIVEQDDWQEEGWSIPGSVEDALADFGDWQPCLGAVLRASEGLFRWALFAGVAAGAGCGASPAGLDL